MQVDAGRQAACTFLACSHDMQALQILDRIVAHNVCYRSPDGCAQGLARVKEHLRGWLRSFSVASHTEDVILGDESQAVVRGVWRGIHSGTFAGVRATQRRVSLPFIVLVRFDQDKIGDIEFFYDPQTLLSEICLVHPHAIR